MKTIYLISHAKVSGPVNQALNILLGMKKNGKVESSLVTLAPETIDGDGSWLYRFEDANINIFKMNQPLWKTIKCVHILKQYISENNVEIIHASGFRAIFVALMGKGNAKVVITQRCDPKEIAEKLPRWIQPLFPGFYLWMIKKTDCIVACSKSIQATLEQEYDMHVEVVQNGVNTEFFKPVDTNEKHHIRKELGLPLDKKTYLVLGSFRRRKNNSLIIEAFKQLQQDDVLVFVGSGEQEELLKESSIGHTNIKFIGKTNTPINYLQAADVLISASLAEGLPNTVLEAISCGLPCILSNINPHKEIIERTNIGILFNPMSVSSLLNAIHETKSWDFSEKSKQARFVAEKNFSITSLAEKYESIYKQLK